MDEYGPNELPQMSDAQLAAYEHGWAVKVMPACGGWKIHYFSLEDFGSQPGTYFPSIEEALQAVYDVLPAANSEEQKAKARADLEERRRAGQDKTDP